MDSGRLVCSRIWKATLSNTERSVIERAELEQHAHPAAHGVELFLLELVHQPPGDPHFAALRLERSADQPQQRGLAAAGQSHDGDDRCRAAPSC